MDLPAEEKEATVKSCAMVERLAMQFHFFIVVLTNILCAAAINI